MVPEKRRVNPEEEGVEGEEGERMGGWTMLKGNNATSYMYVHVRVSAQKSSSMLGKTSHAVVEVRRGSREAQTIVTHARSGSFCRNKQRDSAVFAVRRQPFPCRQEGGNGFCLICQSSRTCLLFHREH